MQMPFVCYITGCPLLCASLQIFTLRASQEREREKDKGIWPPLYLFMQNYEKAIVRRWNFLLCARAAEAAVGMWSKRERFQLLTCACIYYMQCISAGVGENSALLYVYCSRRSVFR